MIEIKKTRIYYVILLFFLGVSITASTSIKTMEEASIHEEANPYKQARSVILLIGDGMSYEHIKLARWAEYGPNNKSLTMETFPYLFDVTTQNINNEITDSAAAATALATGHKTENGMLSIDPSGETIETILEIAKHELNKSVGIVATSEIVHATPAGFMTHVASRYDEPALVDQVVQNNNNVDVLLGGGQDLFSDYYTDWENQGYSVIENKTELEVVPSTEDLRGLFAKGHLPKEQDRDRVVVPSLSEMTHQALERLSTDPNGFFLMVEGSQIDWAGHDNNPVYCALETIAFDAAVQVALDFAKNHEETLVIATSDHETGGLTVLNENIDDPLPASVDDPEDKEQLRINRANDITVEWSSDYHTSKKVPLFGYGDSEFFAQYGNGSTMDNTDVFEMMYDYYSDAQTPEITINSPIDKKTYATTTVELNVSVDREYDWLGYSIDDLDNVTLTSEEIQLDSLDTGFHSLTVYANDTIFGSMASKTVTFSVQLDSSSQSSEDSSQTKNTSGLVSLYFLLSVLGLVIYRKSRLKGII